MHHSRASPYTLTDAAFSSNRRLSIDSILSSFTTTSFFSIALFRGYCHFNIPYCLVLWFLILHRRSKSDLCITHAVGCCPWFTLHCCSGWNFFLTFTRHVLLHVYLAWHFELFLPPDKHCVARLCVLRKPIIPFPIHGHIPQDL